MRRAGISLARRVVGSVGRRGRPRRGTPAGVLFILDEDGIYDPAHFDDRLPLGLRGR